jgi:hypothetical protein
MEPQELIKQIEVAFDRVKRPNISLRQFRLTDLKGMSGDITDEEWKQAGKARQDSKWQNIPDSEIEECDCVLAHMGADEYQYYLPAYIRYSLNHYKLPVWESDIIGATVYSVYPSSKDKDLYKYRINQMSLLNSEQENAIIHFLEFVAENADDVQKPDAKIALDRYWRKKVGT